MQFHDSDEYRHSRDLRVLHSGPSLSREEGRIIFREMVRAEARNGHFTALRRKRLIQYAAALQLTPLDASRIVTEVCKEQSVPDPVEPPALYRFVESAARPEGWPAWAQVAAGVGAAFVILHFALRLF